MSFANKIKVLVTPKGSGANPGSASSENSTSGASNSPAPISDQYLDPPLDEICSTLIFQPQFFSASGATPRSPLPPPPPDLSHFDRIRTQGIQENADIELALEYIETVAPEFGRQLVDAYRKCKNITIVIDPTLKNMSATDMLPIDYFDRNASYPRTIRLEKGTSVLTLIHELVHAIPADQLPDELRQRPFPVQDQAARFGTIREGARGALIFEESNAFGSQMIAYDELRTSDPSFKIVDGLKPLYEVYKAGGDMVAERLTALQKALPRLLPHYAAQARIQSIVVALAGKTGNERNPRFDINHIMSAILGEEAVPEDGKLDVFRVAKVLYELINLSYKGLGYNTWDAAKLIFGEIKAGDNIDSVLDQIVHGLESRFDGTEFTGREDSILTALKDAPSIGDRRVPRDTSKDKGYLSDSEMAEKIVFGWGSVMRFIEVQREAGIIKGADYLRFLLNMAENSPDPYAGKLYGEAWVLSHMQAAARPEMLLMLAASLAKGGYMERAAQALEDYLNVSRTSNVGIFEKKEGFHGAAEGIVTGLKDYTSAAELLPADERERALENLFNRWDYLDTAIFDIEASFRGYFDKDFKFTEGEDVELRSILTGGAKTISVELIDEFIARISRARGLAPKRAETNGFFYDRHYFSPSAEAELRIDILTIYANNTARLIPAIVALKQAGAEPARVAELERCIYELPVLNKMVFEGKWGGPIPEAKDLTEEILRRGLKDKLVRATDVGDVQRNLFGIGWIYQFMHGSPRYGGNGKADIPYFDVFMELLDQMPSGMEKQTIFGSYFKEDLLFFSPEQRLRLFKAAKKCLEDLADIELADPGYVSRFGQRDVKIGEWRSVAGEQRASLEPAMAPKKREHVQGYVSWMSSIINQSFNDGNAELHAFGLECLRSLDLADQEFNLFINDGNVDFETKYDNAVGRNGRGYSYNPYIAGIEDLAFLAKSHIEELHQADQKAAVELLDRIISFYQSGLAGEGSAGRALMKDKQSKFHTNLMELGASAVAIGELDRALEFTRLAAEYNTKFPIDDPVKHEASLHLYEHTRRFLLLAKEGDPIKALSAADMFIKELDADLKGRINYVADELLVYAKMLTTLPGMEVRTEKVLEHVIDRYIRRFGDQSRDFWNRLNPAGLMKAIDEEAHLSAEAKDRLLCRLIDGMAELVTADYKNVRLFFDVLQGINEYARKGRYKEADRHLYTHLSNLLPFIHMLGDRVNPHDITSGISYLSEYYLAENPWLTDPNSSVQLSSSSDWKFLRELAAVFPGQARLLAPVLTDSGELNLEVAQAGFVNIEAFAQEVWLRIEDGRLKGEEASKAVTAAVLGAISNAKINVNGGLEEILAQLPVLEKFIGLVQSEMKGNAAFTETGLASLKGLIDGLDGDSLIRRVAFYADVLQSPKVPMELKREAWAHLKRVYLIGPFLDNYLNRNAVQSDEAGFYKDIGRMLELSRGRLPPDAAIAMFFKNGPARDGGRFFKALEKWCRLIEGPTLEAPVDASNPYDIVFFLYYGRKMGGDLSFPIHQLAEHKDEYNAGIGKIAPRLFSSTGADMFEEVEARLDDRGWRTWRCSLEKTYSGFESYVKVEGIVLPPFLEALPGDVRSLFSAVFLQLVPGERAAVLNKLKEMEDNWSTGKKVCYLLEKLGYAKVGQLLSVSSIMPLSVRKELAPLQDELPPSTKGEIINELQGQLGRFFEQIDPESIEWPPVKSGSIGEVVKARLKDGTPVAIKVITSGRRKAMAEMQRQLLDAVELLKKIGVTNVYGFDLTSTAEQMIRMLNTEMNLESERMNLLTYGELPEGVRRPMVIDAAPQSKTVMVMEWIDGVKLSADAVADEAARSRYVEELASLAAKPFLDGIFQGDPHPGNYMVVKDGQLVMLDFGQVCQVRELHLDNLIALAVSLFSGSDRGMAVANALWNLQNRSSKMPPDRALILAEKVEQVFASNGATPTIETVLKLMAAASGAGIVIADDYNFLLKYYATLEGTIKLLDPKFDMMTSLAPHIEAYARKRFGDDALLKFIETGEMPKPLRAPLLRANLAYALTRGSLPLELIIHDSIYEIYKEGGGSISLVRLANFITLLRDAADKMDIMSNGLGPEFERTVEREVRRYDWRFNVMEFMGLTSKLRLEDIKSVAAGVWINFQTGDSRFDMAADRLFELLDKRVLMTGMAEAEPVLELIRGAISGPLQGCGQAVVAEFYHALMQRAPGHYRPYIEMAFANYSPSATAEPAGSPELKEVEAQLELIENSRLRITDALKDEARALRLMLIALKGDVLLTGKKWCDAKSAIADAELQLANIFSGHRAELTDLAVKVGGELGKLLTIKLLQIPLEDVEHLVREHGIPEHLVGDVLALSASPAFLEKMNGLVAEKLTPEAIERWLATEQGKKFLRDNRDELRNRMRLGLPGLTVGILSLLGAEQLADIIGIDPRYQQIERFAFVIGISHIANVGTGQLQAKWISKSLLAPFQMVGAQVVDASGVKMFQVAIANVGNVFFKGYLQAIKTKFIAEGAAHVVLNGGVAILKFPWALCKGMGLGLATSKVAELVIPGNSDLKNKIVFLSFFAPDVARIIFGGAKGKLARIGLGVVGSVFSAGFFLDLVNMGFSRLYFGEASGYENWVNLRASEMKDDAEGTNSIDLSTDWWILPLLGKGIDNALELIAPQSAADADSRDDALRKTEYWYQVRKEDRELSLQLQGQMKQDFMATVIGGSNPGDVYDPGFYRSTEFRPQDFVAMDGVEDKAYEHMKEIQASNPEMAAIELIDDVKNFIRTELSDEGVSEEELDAMMIRLNKRQMLDQLYFIGLGENDNVRSFADSSGRITDMNGFCRFGAGRECQEMSREVLFGRKVALAAKIMSGGGDYDLNRLKETAEAAGLTGQDGRWLEQDVYLAARQQWIRISLASEKDEGVKLQEIAEYTNELIERAVDPATSQEAQELILSELGAIGAIPKGSPLVVLF